MVKYNTFMVLWQLQEFILSLVTSLRFVIPPAVVANLEIWHQHVHLERIHGLCVYPQYLIMYNKGLRLSATWWSQRKYPHQYYNEKCYTTYTNYCIYDVFWWII